MGGVTFPQRQCDIYKKVGILMLGSWCNTVKMNACKPGTCFGSLYRGCAGYVNFYCRMPATMYIDKRWEVFWGVTVARWEVLQSTIVAKTHSLSQ